MIPCPAQIALTRRGLLNAGAILASLPRPRSPRWWRSASALP